MNELLHLDDSDLLARVREHTDGAVDAEIEELERRLIVLYIRVLQLRDELEVEA